MDTFDSEIAELWNTGDWTKAAIARRMGVSPRTIGRHLDALALTNSNAADTTHDTELEDLAFADEFWDDYEDLHNSDADDRQQYTYAWVKNGSSTIICRIDLESGQTESVRVLDFRDTESPEDAFNRSFYGYDKMVVGAVTADFAIGKITFAGSDGKQYDLPQDLIESIVHAHDAKGGNRPGVQRLMEFANRLSNNPSPKVFDRLFSYLVGNGIVIQDDGTVMCYKRIRDDYMDIHSGTFRNAPGDQPTMPRSQVDDNDAEACSKGLHVCSLDYLPTYGSHDSRTDRIVTVQVDPADFVSIPMDNVAKARTCRYLVVADVSDEFNFLNHEEATA